MSANLFADSSKNLYSQIKIIEDLTKSGQFKEANRLLLAAEKNCGNLELMVQSDNKLQTHIINNRRQEIRWLHDTIDHGLVKSPSKRKKKSV